MAQEAPRKWTSVQYAYAAFAANGGCLLVLLANLATGNQFWQVAVALAAVCLAVGGFLGIQSRRYRIREQRGD